MSPAPGKLPLRDRVAVVTGATGLLGRHHCTALAESGASVVAVDLALEPCQALAEELTRLHGACALGVACDVTDPDGLAGLRERVLGRFGGIDVLVNNAAVDEKVEGSGGDPELSRFERLPLAVFERSLRVNVTGTFLCCQALGSEMARRGSGSIVNIASTYALVAPDQSLYRSSDGSQSFYKSAAYPTSKGAVLSLTRYLAAYWGRNGVRVNALCPGGVENGQTRHFLDRYAERTPLGRMARPWDYTGALIFLACDASAYMTGAELVVDGGFTAW